MYIKTFILDAINRDIYIYIYNLLQKKIDMFVQLFHFKILRFMCLNYI